MKQNEESVVTTNCEKSAEAIVPQVKCEMKGKQGLAAICHEAERRTHMEACCPKHLIGSRMEPAGRAEQWQFFEVRGGEVAAMIAENHTDMGCPCEARVEPEGNRGARSGAVAPRGPRLGGKNGERRRM
jgi:hypothetical protein